MLAKKCTRCEILKQENEYYIQKAGLLGRKSICKQCAKEYDDNRGRQKRKPPISLENELWIPCIGYENLYMISNLGRIKRLDAYFYHKGLKKIMCRNSKILPCSDSNGYRRVSLTKYNVSYTFSVHRLVMLSFKVKKTYLYQTDVNHINGIKDDNRLENLEWVSKRENTSHGFHRKNEKTSKYTNVYYSKLARKWGSCILVDKKVEHLGFFDSELSAFEAFKKRLNNLGETNKYEVYSN